jgi:hypothetical protein
VLRPEPVCAVVLHARTCFSLFEKGRFFVSTPTGSAQKFVTTVASWLTSLPHDLRVLFEAKDEPNLDRVAREAAAGAIIHTLTPEQAGSGMDNAIGRFADDAILIRHVLKFVAERGGEGASDFRERFAEHYEALDEGLDVCKAQMGDTYDWIAGKVGTLNKLVYKGKKLADYLDDDEAAELLYEDSLAFATDYPLDEEKLSMRLKKAETVLEPLRRKAEIDRKKL